MEGPSEKKPSRRGRKRLSRTQLIRKRKSKKEPTGEVDVVPSDLSGEIEGLPEHTGSLPGHDRLFPSPEVARTDNEQWYGQICVSLVNDDDSEGQTTSRRSNRYTLPVLPDVEITDILLEQDSLYKRRAVTSKLRVREELPLVEQTVQQQTVQEQPLQDQTVQQQAVQEQPLATESQFDEVPSPIYEQQNQPDRTDDITEHPQDVTFPILSNVTMEAVITYLNRQLPLLWLAQRSFDGVRVICLSPKVNVAVQRSVFVPFSGGSARLFVHNVELGASALPETAKNIAACSEDYETFAVDVLGIVKVFCTYEVCCGADEDQRFKPVWHSAKDCHADSNIWGENRFGETVRSTSCPMLVSQRSKRCSKCTLLSSNLRRCLRRRLKSNGRPTGPICYLTPKRLKQGLKVKQKYVRNYRKKYDRLKKRMADVLQRQGVDVDESFHEDLSEAVGENDRFAKLFLEQQISAAKAKDSRVVRWHPVMIRWALHLNMISSVAYTSIRESGFIKLPSERTLYDYTHVNTTKEGLNSHTIRRISEKFEKYDDYQKYHALLFDEMYISQNLVYHQGTGEIVGYTKLSEVEEEMRCLENRLQSEIADEPPPIATKMLTYMVKGICSDVKEVVASYTTSTLSSETLFDKTWDVINILETAGIRVLTITGDGCPANGAFFDSHTPITPTTKGLVFSTYNFCAPEGLRPIFFLSDPPHLLKTVRNCFANSGAHKNTRLLQKNKQIITWNTIIRLFKEEENDDVKLCHKLNRDNVFLNGYSVMNVRSAARVMSATVASAIELLAYKNCEETVKFIRLVNDFFDCLNGAHSSESKKKRNPKLAAYTDVEDSRFEFLMGVIQYFHEWEAEVKALPIGKGEKTSRLISTQTMRGIERTILAFIGAVQFMLNLKPTTDGGRARNIFVMARAFQQDYLEHFFSKQRAKGGGATNPDVQSFLANQHSVQLQGEIGLKRRRGNTEHIPGKINIEEPLPKRKRHSRRSIVFTQDKG